MCVLCLPMNDGTDAGAPDEDGIYPMNRALYEHTLSEVANMRAEFSALPRFRTPSPPPQPSRSVEDVERSVDVLTSSIETKLTNARVELQNIEERLNRLQFGGTTSWDPTPWIMDRPSDSDYDSDAGNLERWRGVLEGHDTSDDEEENNEA